MKKTKKRVNVIVIIAVVVTAVLFFVPFLTITLSKRSAEKNLSSTGLKTINEQLSEAEGVVNLSVTGRNVLEVSNADGNLNMLGGAFVEEITIDGGLNGATVLASGTGNGAICVNNDGILRFKNITFEDNTINAASTYRDYLLFGGKLYFENCKFVGSIFLSESTVSLDAKFVACRFDSIQPDKKAYSVWVGDGNATFERCSFFGFRGLKIHEFTTEKHLNGDVERVTVESCLFYEISEKPGVVIGTFVHDPASTTVAIKNSKFYHCFAWNSLTSLEGVNGFYETDISITSFRMVLENNIIDYDPSICFIKYVGVDASNTGKIIAIPDCLWKADGNYPTTYKVGEMTQISDLLGKMETFNFELDENELPVVSLVGSPVSDPEDSNVTYSFYGWYLDQACTKPFTNADVLEFSGNVTLYAKIDIGYWTLNY